MRNLFLQLADSKGLGRVVLFDGLDYTMVVRPAVHGEPLLTTQGIYYLALLESVAHVRGNTEDDTLPEERVEYVLDNYLFEFSKRHPASRMTFKVVEGMFWIDDPDSKYNLADHGCTKTLALDQLNDPAVREVSTPDPLDDVDLDDWDIGRSYGHFHVANAIREIGALLEKKVHVEYIPANGRDGYLGRIRVVKALEPFIDYFQAVQMDSIRARNIAADATEVSLGTSDIFSAETALPIERITVRKKHSPILLAHFYSGVKELNPLKGYLSYYNVLEYYFEEAPALLGRAAKFELDQLKCTLEILITDAEVQAALAALDAEIKRQVFADMPTSSALAITRLTGQGPKPKDELARWLYDIRCAVVHSKKTRKGQATASFEPYSEAAKNVAAALPLIRDLAIRCIEKDALLQPLGYS